MCSIFKFGGMEMNKNRNMGIVQQEQHSSHDRGGSSCSRKSMLVLIATIMCMMCAEVTMDEAIFMLNKSDTCGGTKVAGVTCVVG